MDRWASASSRACQRGQNRAPAGAVSRRSVGVCVLVRAGARARAHRAEPVGRRPGRARPPGAEPALSSAARSGRSTTSSRGLLTPAADARPVVSDAQRSLLVRRIVGDASLNGLGRSARFAGFADLARHDAGRARVRPGRPGRPRRRSRPPLRRRTAAELDRLGRWDRDRLRGAPSSASQSSFDAWHGEPVLRLRLRGSDRRRVGAAARARRPHRGDGLAAVRAGPRRVRVAAPRRWTTSARSRTAGSRCCRRASTSSRRRRWRTSSGRSSSTTRREPPPHRGRRPLLRGRGHARDPRARRGGDPRARPGRHRAGADRPHLPSVERWSAPLETGLGALGVPYRGRGTARVSRRRRSAARCSRPAALRVARRRPARSLRLPAHAVLRRAAREGRLPRGTASRPGRETRRPRRGRDAALHGHPFPIVKELRERRRRSRPGRRGARMLRAAHGLHAPPVGRGGAQDLRAYEAVSAARRRARRLGRARRHADRGGDRRRARTYDGPRLATAASRAASRSLDLLRARTRQLRGRVPARARGGEPAAADAGLAVPRRRHARARRSRARALVKPDPGRARPLPLLHGVHARDAAALSRARGGERRRDAARAEPVLGRGRASLPARRGGTRDDASPLSALTWPLDTAPTDRERLRALAALAADDEREAEALAYANGWERRLDRALRAFTATRGCAIRSSSSSSASARASTSPSSSASPTARPRGSSTGCSIRGRSTPQVDPKLRGSVAHSALHKFFGGIPKELGVERLDETQLDAALPFLRRCLDQASWKACGWS